jgi:hypothetical protein
MSTLRQVRRLELQAASPQAASSARTALEDALRTASLHDEDRHIVIHRLDLGRMPVTASPGSWALRLEEAVRRLGPSALRFDHPEAALSGVVWFPGRHGASLACLHRLALGQSPDEWFWAAALPILRRTASTDVAIRHLLAELCETAPRPLLVMLRGLPDTATRLNLLVKVQSRQAQGLLEVARELNDTAASFAIPDSHPAGRRTSLTSHHPVDLSFLNWPTDDPRLTLISLLNDPAPSSGQDRFSQPRLPQATLPVKQEAHPSRASGETPTASGTDLRLHTELGGLFFLLRLLDREPYCSLLLSRLRQRWDGLGWRILHVASRHVCPEETDPLQAQLPLPLDTLERGLAWRCLLRCARACRRSTDLSLAALLRRPALFSFTEQSVDLFFRPGDASLAIRKAGLDLNPGWVPWLGRVVNFHYTLDS